MYYIKNLSVVTEAIPKLCSFTFAKPNLKCRPESCNFFCFAKIMLQILNNLTRKFEQYVIVHIIQNRVSVELLKRNLNVHYLFGI